MLIPEGGVDPADRRASDTDRQRVIAILRQQAADGALTIDELEERMGLIFQAKTIGQLSAVMWDLDVSKEEPARRRRRGLLRNTGFRYHAAAYAMVNGLMVGTWATASPHALFWPVFPAMGWGVGLGMHALTVKTKEERQAERAERQAFRAVHPGPRPTPVAPPLSRPPEPARRFVAVMFTDIANSTRLNEALGDADWSRLRTRHRDFLLAAFARYGGSEVNSQGDGCMARFETPASAVKCAVDVQRQLEHQRDAGFAPTVRIGIHAGEAVEDLGDLVGSVVNVASRVMGEAEPGEILVTEPVAEQVEASFDLQDKGVHTLRGVTRPRHLLAVHWRD